MSRSRVNLAPIALTIASAAFVPAAALADTVVQVPLTGLLDARSVTTLTHDQLVVFTLPTDGGMLQNAFATKAVAAKQGKPEENALPNDGKFPADARHPEVVLHFSNAADPTSPQTHLVPLSGKIEFDVPQATYSKVFLFFNGAAGGTTITTTLVYEDGMDQQMAKVPDYYADVPANDPIIFNLATNLAKWDKTTKINEANHHNITGVEVPAKAGKTLKSVQVQRDNMGNLVFWGATAIATSDVPEGGAGGGGGMAGAAAAEIGGAGGTAGASNGGVGGSSAGVAGAGAGTGGVLASRGGNAGSAGVPTTAGSWSNPVGSIRPSDERCSFGAASAGASRAGWYFAALGLIAFGRRRRFPVAPSPGNVPSACVEVGQTVRIRPPTYELTSRVGQAGGRLLGAVHDAISRRFQR